MRCKVICFTPKTRKKDVSQMFEKNLLLPCLLDIYGSLLTDRKRELLDYYYEEDYSLSEISELTGISRQGVRDSLKKSESELLEFESKLRLYEKKTSLTALLTEAMKSAEALESETSHPQATAVKTRLLAMEELL